jgi:hypothetical protein
MITSLLGTQIIQAVQRCGTSSLRRKSPWLWCQAAIRCFQYSFLYIFVLLCFFYSFIVGKRSWFYDVRNFALSYCVNNFMCSLKFEFSITTLTKINYTKLWKKNPFRKIFIINFKSDFSLFTFQNINEELQLHKTMSGRSLCMGVTCPLLWEQEHEWKVPRKTHEPENNKITGQFSAIQWDY